MLSKILKRHHNQLKQEKKSSEQIVHTQFVEDASTTSVNIASTVVVKRGKDTIRRSEEGASSGYGSN